MICLSLDGITLSFGTDVILKDITLSVNEGDRVGIIGVNGAGKTSLFRVITGEYTPDAGAVYIQKGLKIGVLTQNPRLTDLPAGASALEYMYSAFDSLIALENKIKSTEDALAEAASCGKTEEVLILSERLKEENRIFADRGGLEFRGRCRGMLLRLGFDDELITRPLSTLSGGQYTRVALARLLATEPDILMLDEPTNHLDIDALAWLESYLASYKKTVLIISHDRYFLDKTTNKTVQLLYGRARMWGGSYSECKEKQEKERAEIEKRYREQQKVIAKIRANIEFQRRCNREHNFVTIRSKEKQLARMEKIELTPNDPRGIRMSFLAEEESAGDVCEVKDLAFSYGSGELIKNLSFLVRRYERVMVLGPNGSGKSTLMKLLNSLLVPTEGKITLGYNIKIGYYDQENRGLSESNTVFEEMRLEYPDKTDLELRSTLALFLFGAEDMDKRVSTLSGGERARLTLSKLILKKVNLLIMDEPTNHLDISSAEALEGALAAFPGTIIAVSHDRYFINKIATRIIELAPERERGMISYELTEDDDAFSEYMRLRALATSNSTQQAQRTQVSDGRADYEERKRQAAEIKKQERKIERAKADIEKLEEELTALEEELFTTAQTNYVRAAEIDTRKGEIEEKLLELYEIVM